jgi:hypothetical protein
MEATIGMNTASVARVWMDDSKRIALDEDGARRVEHGLVAGDAAEALDVLGGLLANDVEHVVHADRAEEPPVDVDDGNLDQIVVLDEPGHFLLVRVHTDAFHLIGADRTDGCRRVGGQEPMERDDAHQMVVVVHDIEIKRALARRRLADVLDRLGDGGLLAHGDELRRHQPPRRAFLVLEELLDLLGLLLLHQLEDFVRLLLGKLLDDVHDLLRRHPVEDTRDFDFRERADELAQGGVVQLGEHLARMLRREEAEETDLILRRQLADHARHICGMRVLQQVGEPLVAALAEQLLDRFAQAFGLFHLTSKYDPAPAWGKGILPCRRGRADCQAPNLVRRSAFAITSGIRC